MKKKNFTPMRRTRVSLHSDCKHVWSKMGNSVRCIKCGDKKGGIKKNGL